MTKRTTERTDRERLLGLEVAKLALRIHSQRIAIAELKGPIKTQIQHDAIKTADVMRENRVLRDQIARLIIENRTLRLHIASTKV